jgi:hypothetical protein
MCEIAGWVSCDGDLREERDSKPAEMFTIRRHQSTQMTVNGTYFSRFADQEKLEK